ncbi:MAG: hypothetical protein HYX26_03525 [Acidobacteriales bacterium]|nr:hypothetical protein [Terriglobales bacterium]
MVKDTPKGRNFARHVFQWSGIYGLLVLAPQYFLETRLGRDQPLVTTNPEHFYGFVGLALVWQIAFLVIASDPVRFRPLMLIGVLEKLSFFLPVTVMFAQGRVQPLVLGFAIFDLFLGVLFLAAWRATREEATSHHVQRLVRT